MKYPDVWVLVKVTSPKGGKIVKVLGGWYGGYLAGDSWQLSSGVVKVEDTYDGYYLIYNHSGSVYRCHKDTERTSIYTEGIINTWVRELRKLADGSKMELISMEEYLKY